MARIRTWQGAERTRRGLRPAVERMEERTVLSHVAVGPNVDILPQTFTQVEPTIAVNPRNTNNIVALAMNQNPSNPQGSHLFAAYSKDGGHSWHMPRGLPAMFSDVQTAWDRFGNLFVVYINGSAMVSMSSDGGATFHQIASLGKAVDQPSIAVGKNSVWVDWRDAQNFIAAAGASVTGLGRVGKFSTPEVAPGSGQGDFGDIAVGPTGAVMVVYQHDNTGAGPDTIQMNVDPDGFGGRGFGQASTIVTTQVGGFHVIPAQPNRDIDAEANLAWDGSGGKHNGRVYLVYVQAPSPSSTQTRVLVQHSDNNGASWSSPVPVSHSPSTNSELNPSIALDPWSGHLAVAWYDARVSPTNLFAGLFVSFSTNGGQSFGSERQISRGISYANGSAPPPPGWTIGQMDYGDFTQDKAAFVRGVFYPIWVDNSNSTGTNPNGTFSKMDLYTARIGFHK